MDKSLPNISDTHIEKPDIEYDLIDILSRAFSNIKILVCLALLGFITSTVFCYFIENEYTSYAILAPAIQENSSIVSSLSDSLTGISNLAGINLSSNDSEKEKAIAILTSRQHIQKFIADNDLMREIFHKRWDHSASEWREPNYVQKAKIRFDKLYNSLAQSQNNYAPNIDDGYRKFTEEVLTVKTDKKTGFLHLSITTHSPELSQKILDKFIHQSNEHIRNIEIQELQKNNKYLREKIEETNVTYIRAVMNDLIRTNIQNSMLTETKDEYAFEVLEPPTLLKRHSYPKRALLIAGFTFFCLVFGFIVSIWLSIKNSG
jgi:uncharacterized protein involved in exopolysaccharide biosynthesis